MKLGAEPKKLAMLGGLVAVAIIVYFMNASPGNGGDAASPGTSSPRPAVGVPAASPGAAKENPAVRSARRRGSTEFKVTLKPPRPEDRPDPMTIDPTLRLDLLAKLQTVGVEGIHRSIFDFGQVPAPKAEAPQIAAAKVKVPSPIVPVIPVSATGASTEPVKPTAPPIPLKFYGYVNPSGRAQKRAFFIEGEDIHVVVEGELVKKRYKIVRIGVNSVIVEDTEFGSQQTLPLEEQQG